LNIRIKSVCGRIDINVDAAVAACEYANVATFAPPITPGVSDDPVGVAVRGTVTYKCDSVVDGVAASTIENTSRVRLEAVGNLNIGRNGTTRKGSASLGSDIVNAGDLGNDLRSLVLARSSVGIVGVLASCLCTVTLEEA